MEFDEQQVIEQLKRKYNQERMEQLTIKYAREHPEEWQRFIESMVSAAGPGLDLPESLKQIWLQEGRFPTGEEAANHFLKK